MRLRLIAPVALAAVGLTSALAPAGAVANATAEPSVSVLTPVIDSTIGMGDLPVKVAVDLGGAASGRLDVTLGYYISGQTDIPAGSCDSGCEVTVTVKIGDWEHPRPVFGYHLLSAKLTTSSGAETSAGGQVYFSGPVAVAEVRHIRDSQVYGEAVVDADGTFRVSTQNPPGDAVAEVRLVDSAGVAHLTASAPFTATRGVAHDALFDLDFQAVPSGLYRLQTRNRGTDGFYGSGQEAYVRVNHVDPAVFDAADDKPLVVGTAGFTTNVKVQSPLLSGSKPSTVQLTVDGVNRTTSLTPTWQSWNWQTPGLAQTVHVTMDGPQLALGTHQLTLKLLDTTGRLIGKPVERTVEVSDFKVSVTAPTLVVGRRSPVALSVDAPAGRLLSRCDVQLSAPGYSYAVGSWCAPRRRPCGSRHW
ncbi:hypothetical protein GCM10009789_08120 [Kribbella sancticallisti]|uniref:Carboxypeptidase regulatory-like domain-containing protein n=1 Tax=Kribbella sancticallisti TaxID=460087 RepID=A0ABN2CG95_9ACTN